MKKIFSILFAILILFVTYKISYSDNPSLQIEVLSKIEKVTAPGMIKIPVRITNVSSVPQNIGTEICGVHGVQGWSTDKDFLISDGWMCDQNGSPDRPIILNSGDTYEQVCEVHFVDGKTKFERFNFRLCIQGTVCSKAIDVEVIK